MLNEKVGVAVAGLGFVGGRAHVPAVRKISGANLVAVIDISEELAKRESEKNGVKYYTDFGQALDDPDIEAVIIAVPTPFHYRLASDALRSGKHVLLEIPMASTIDEAKQLRDQAKDADLILMPDLNFHFAPIYVKVKELIEKNRVCQPISATFVEHIAAKDLTAQWPPGSWAWDSKKSGGLPNYTLSFWSIDLVRWLLGEIEDVKWMSNYTLLDGFGGVTGYNTVGILRFSSGAVGNLHYSSTVVSGEGSSRLEIIGSNTKALRTVWNNSLTLTGENDEKELWQFDEKGTRAWGHRQIDEHFVECVLKRQKPSVTPDDAIEVQRVAKQMVN
jgi:predicted dehydrogenase